MMGVLFLDDMRRKQIFVPALTTSVRFSYVSSFRVYPALISMDALLDIADVLEVARQKVT